MNTLYRNRKSFVTLQLPSDCSVGFLTNESEKQDIITFCTNLPKKERGSIFMELPRDNDQKRKESPYKEMSRDRHQKRCV